MFINPDGRAIEYMGQLDETQVSVRVWRKSATNTARQWKQSTVLTHASLFHLGGAAGLHTFPVRDLGQLLRGKWRQSSNREDQQNRLGAPDKFKTCPPLDPDTQRILRKHLIMPNNTVCFTDGSWTAATPIGHRFSQEPSPKKENVSTAGIFYCADSPDWERPP